MTSVDLTKQGTEQGRSKSDDLLESLSVKYANVKKPALRVYDKPDYAIRDKNKDFVGAITEEEAMFSEMVRRDLKLFVRFLWPETDGSTPLEWNWHLDEICQALQEVFDKKVQYLVINVPPGTMKSTIVSVMYSAWVWLPGNDPEHSLLCVSGAGRVAERDSVKVRDSIIGSERYKRLCLALSVVHEPLHSSKSWPWALTTGQKAKLLYSNSAGGTRRAITSRSKYTGLRGDVIIFDDPYDVDDVISGDHERIAERMQDLRSQFVNKMMSRRNNESSDPVVLIMQRLHESDLSAYMMETYIDDPKAKFLVFPMEYDPEISSPYDPRAKEGELLFANSKRFTKDKLAKTRSEMSSTGLDQWPAQYGQRPVAGSGGIFKVGFFTHVFPWEPNWRRNAAVPRPMRVVLSVDPTNTATSKSDSAVWTVWAEDSAGHDWLADAMEKKVELPELITVTLSLVMAHRPDVVLVEEMGNGIGLILAVQEAFPHLTVIGVKPLREKGFKVTRAANTTDRWESGKVHTPMDAPFSARMRRQFLSFPRGRNDDWVDSSCQYLTWKKTNREGLFQYRIGDVMADDGVAEVDPRTGETLRIGAPEENKPEDLRQLPHVNQGQILWAGLMNMSKQSDGSWGFDIL